MVVGEGIARELSRDRTAAAIQDARNAQRLDVGDVFTLAGRQWLVAGVMKSAGSTFDSEVWAKRSIIGPMFGKDTYTSLVLRATDGSAAERLKDFLNLEYKKAAVQALLEEEYFANLSQTNRQFLVSVIFVVFWLAVGGACGLMNTMFAAVSQRKRDIGVLRLLGFARWQILASLLIEALLLGLVGGLLGCGLGSLCDGVKASSIVSSGQGGVGKSVLARLLAQYHIDRGLPFSAFDSDRSHGALLRFYGEFSQPLVLDDFESAACVEPEMPAAHHRAGRVGPRRTDLEAVIEAVEAP